MRYLECLVPDIVSIVDPVRNRCNDQYVDFGDNVEDQVRYISSMKHVPTVIFLGLMCSNGEVLPPILLESSYRLNTDEYIDIMISTIIPWDEKGGWQEEICFPRAPAYTANKTQALLKKIDF